MLTQSGEFAAWAERLKGRWIISEREIIYDAIVAALKVGAPGIKEPLRRVIARNAMQRIDSRSVPTGEPKDAHEKTDMVSAIDEIAALSVPRVRRDT